MMAKAGLTFAGEIRIRSQPDKVRATMRINCVGAIGLTFGLATVVASAFATSAQAQVKFGAGGPNHAAGYDYSLDRAEGGEVLVLFVHDEPVLSS
jgi:hypothetical protein